MSNPKITFVNHASYKIDFGNVSLITDPWLYGSAFNDGWDLLVPTPEQFLNFDGVTHIWFSHEHPDHFAPAVLKSIAPEKRQDIEVLYQETEDKKVINFCKKIGFRTRELQPNQPVQIGEDFSFQCAPFTDGDSWSYAMVGGKGILNLNDCIFSGQELCRSILQHIESVDLLFTQFGYAHKVGNEDDDNLRIEKANEKLSRIRVQDIVFKPTYICPFASFVYFSHEENDYMNRGQNTVIKTHEFIKEKTSANPIILYPEDIFIFQKFYDNAEALRRYELRYEQIKNLPKRSSLSVIESKLVNESVSYGQKLVKNNPTARRLINKINPKIFITDFGRAFVFKGESGLKPAKYTFEDCDVSIHSSSLQYMFQFDWGGGSSHINGRYQIPPNGDFYKIFLFIKMGSLNNQGLEYKWAIPSVRNRISNKLRSFLLMGKK